MKDQNKVTEPELLIIDAHGVYIPHLFAKNYGHYIEDQARFAQDIELLIRFPSEDNTLIAWDNILNNATLVNDNGQRFTLYQDGDLWVIPEDFTEDQWEEFFPEH